MLTELSIQNFAIIDDVSITFNEGLTVLTGETGAGKSIIIDAIQLLAGGRGSVDYVRHQAKKAEIEGLFIIESSRHPIYEVAKQYGIEISDAQVVLERTITSSGKSICRVNGKLVTLAILREFGKRLIDIHSQHETQSLMDVESHIEFLDMYDAENIRKAKEEYMTLYEKYNRLEERYKQLSENEQELAHRQDLLEFQLKELEQADLKPDEDEILEKERNSLANFEKIHLALQTTYSALYGEGKGLDWLNEAMMALNEQEDIDSFIGEKAEELENHYYALEAMAFDIRNYLDQLEFQPDRLNEIEARLNEINRLKKKYGPTVNEMITFMAKVEEELEEITNKDSHLSTLAAEMEEIKKDAFLEAEHLHELRKKAAKELTEEIHKELKSLYLDKATFQVSFEHDKNEPTLHKNGFDEIRFMISTNPGEPVKDLTKVASGGELSRIMLVLKKIFANHQGVTSVIFDEVDTGVSGRVAQAMAEKIYDISKTSQVLCITHLPQVAAMADTHKLIEKGEKDGRTSTSVTELDLERQMEELSRMITGTELTETAKDHAREMLDLAEQFKKETSRE